MTTIYIVAIILLIPFSVYCFWYAGKVFKRNGKLKREQSAFEAEQKVKQEEEVRKKAQEYWVSVQKLEDFDSIRIFKNIIKDIGNDDWAFIGIAQHDIELVIESDVFESMPILKASVDYPTPPRAKIKRNGVVGYIPYSISDISPRRVTGHFVYSKDAYYARVDVQSIVKEQPDFEEYKISEAVHPELFFSFVDVVGIPYHDGKKILSGIVRDMGDRWNLGGVQEHELELVLKAEPDNPHDENAIAVYADYPTPPRARFSRSGIIGYLPRETAAKIKLSDDFVVPAVVKEAGDYISIKVNLGKMKKS